MLTEPEQADHATADPRQANRERGAAAGLGRDVDGAAVGADDGADEAETEAEPALGPTLVAAIEALPDAGQVVRGDPGARVGDLNQHVAVRRRAR